ncbi:hypothetical protein [Streptomyces sp. NPDC051577]
MRYYTRAGGCVRIGRL